MTVATKAAADLLGYFAKGCELVEELRKKLGGIYRSGIAFGKLHKTEY